MERWTLQPFLWLEPFLRVEPSLWLEVLLVIFEVLLVVLEGNLSPGYEVV